MVRKSRRRFFFFFSATQAEEINIGWKRGPSRPTGPQRIASQLFADDRGVSTEPVVILPPGRYAKTGIDQSQHSARILFQQHPLYSVINSMPWHPVSPLSGSGCLGFSQCGKPSTGNCTKEDEMKACGHVLLSHRPLRHKF